MSALYNDIVGSVTTTKNDFMKLFGSKVMPERVSPEFRREKFETKGDSLRVDPPVQFPSIKKCPLTDQKCTYTAQGDILCGKDREKTPHVCFGVNDADGNPLYERGFSQYSESKNDSYPGVF